MTDVDLQTALMREVREVLDTQGLKNMDDDGTCWKDFNVYRQNLPLKDDDEDWRQTDYIIVIIGDEDTDEEGDWMVQMHMSMSIMSMDPARNGDIVLANLMNQIDLHLSKKGIIDGRYELQKERHKRFNDECMPNEYECDLITIWKIPGSHMEGIGELI
jgi:hypothetical protein